MTTIKEETPRSAPPPTLPRTLPAKVMIVEGNLRDYVEFSRYLKQHVQCQNYLK